jgi:hypothetical protein
MKVSQAAAAIKERIKSKVQETQISSPALTPPHSNATDGKAKLGRTRGDGKGQRATTNVTRLGLNDHLINRTSVSSSSL